MKTKLHFLKKSTILFALLFSAFTFNLNAQSTCNNGGITISSTGTSASLYFSPASNNNGCPRAPYSGFQPWTGPTSTGILTYTFSSSVTSVRIAYTAVNNMFDSGTISTNTGGTLTLSNPCNLFVNGVVIIGSTGTNTYGDAWVTVTSTTPFTSVTLTNTGGSTGFMMGDLCNIDFTLVCLDGEAPKF